MDQEFIAPPKLPPETTHEPTTPTREPTNPTPQATKCYTSTYETLIIEF